MTNKWMLDSGPLGRLAHPRRNPEIAAWFNKQISDEIEIIIPEISDYEVRRNLILESLEQSIERLNLLKTSLTYQPISTEVMLLAAELWAQARKSGMPGADKKELDGDVILAAQAQFAQATVITENPGHLIQFVDVKHWRDI